MTSKTTKLMRIRDRKMITSGSKRKNLVRAKGTTVADLPLDRPNANEVAMQKARAARAAKA